MFLIIGLGNPGQKYQNTWHNLGFLVLDEFARENSFPDFRSEKKSNSLVSKREGAILAKPQTFMNDSGKAVKELTRRYSLDANQLIIIHDDADLHVGQIRVSKNRGTAGHKGVESIIKALKTKNFTRIRIGSRPNNYVPGSKMLVRFVLKKFTKNDEKFVEETIEKTISVIEMILEGNSAKAMNEYNK
jgi:PTH1 family peptidyl-tRNA hydrolase